MGERNTRTLPIFKGSLKKFFFAVTAIALTCLLTAAAFLLSLPAFWLRLQEKLVLLRLFAARAALAAQRRARSTLAAASGPLLKAARDLSKIPDKSFQPCGLPLAFSGERHFSDGGQWRKSSLMYLGSCACLFVSASLFLPLHKNGNAFYHVTGPLARKPVVQTSQDFLNLPNAHSVIIPLSFETLQSAAPPAQSAGALGSARVFRARATQMRAKENLAEGGAWRGPDTKPRRGHIIFAKGQVGIRTVAGAVHLNSAEGHAPMCALSSSSGRQDFGAQAPGGRSQVTPFARQAALRHGLPALAPSSHADDSLWAELMAKEPEPVAEQCRLKKRVNRSALYSLARSLDGSGEKSRLHKEKYRAVAREYAEKYQLATSLLLAIMHTESGFNPHAVSPKKAIGLMQVVPHTAGNEVHRFLKGAPGVPSVDALFNPENNIRYGATYLHILDRYYFVGVHNSASRQLCVIAGYNGGPNAVLRHFHHNRETALKKINAMSSEQLYKILTNRFPYAETRRYVQSVKARMENYSAF